MNTAALREQIAHALQHEAASGQLLLKLEQHLPRLHPAIDVVEGDAHTVLKRFISAYIEYVPDLLDAAHHVAIEAGIEDRIKPVLRIASQFFSSPPAIVGDHVGLDSLLDEAYLANRLVEEVNDLYIRHLGQPLIPSDSTVANVIAHQLIGEDFANRLDEVVHHAVREMLDEDSFSQASVEAYRTRLSHTEAAWQRWPCLSMQLGIGLKLEGLQTDTVH